MKYAAMNINFDSLGEAYGFPEGWRDPSFHEVADRLLDIADRYGFKYSIYIIAKDLDGPYLLSSRDPTWLKRKPMITLDLVVLAAVFAVTTKERAGLFGSYVIGARTKENTFEDVGDVAGVDRVRDAEIQTEIMREGLITGRRIERQSASGVRPGLELKPHLVITVRFEGITRDYQTQVLSLRDPKLVHIRSDKTPLEASTVDDIEEIFLRQRVG